MKILLSAPRDYATRTRRIIVEDTPNKVAILLTKFADEKNESVVKKVTFKNHKRIDRLPILKMQSSIADKSFSIDEKFKLLN